MTSSPQSSDEGTDAFRDILSNWWDELHLIAAEIREKMFVSGDSGTKVAFDTHAISVRDGEVELGAIPLREDATSDALVRDLSRLCGGKAGGVVLQLARDEVLRPTLRMPRASKRMLREALGYELGRLSPLETGDLYFDFHALPQQEKAQTLEIELRIVRRAVVERAVAICHVAGLQVASIVFEDDGREADWQMFPVDRQARLFALWHRWSTVLLSGLAGLLFAAAIFAAYVRLGYSAELLGYQVSEAQSRAALVEHMERDIRAIALQSEFLNRQKRAPLLVSVLADISRILPDNTWLSEIEESGKTIRIRGYSSAPSSLIALIDNSSHFTNAQFAAPLVQDAPGKASRFDLTFEVRP